MKMNRLKFYKKKFTPWYRNDYKKFLSLNLHNNDFEIKDNFPCIKDKFLQSGEIKSGHYFLQDIYMAREIYKAHPVKHVDIGSRIDGFITHLAVFREVEVFDIRPLEVSDKNIIFTQADLTKVDKKFIEYTDSISCLHTIEHFGLGRYGDEIDPDGHLKGFEVITNILKPSGKFYFSVPMGKNRIEFNAHRIFSLSYLLSWVTKRYEIVKFSYIDDNNLIHEDILLTDDLIKNNCYCNLGCALFVLNKLH